MLSCAMKIFKSCFVFGLLLLTMAAPTWGANKSQEYAVVVSKNTLADAGWKKVVDALVKEHNATVVTFDNDVDDTLPELRRQFPRYVCFVAQPTEAGRKFVGKVHRLTRRFDDDPYTDCFWGILTGYDAANALRIAQYTQPLTIRKTAAATEVALDMCEAGVWYSELQKNRTVRKEPGHAPVECQGPDDTTEALADLLTDYHADLFITSGHASERDWRIGYAYRNGSFRCENGRLYGLDTSGQRHPIQSDNAKVFMPIGNCLMGHIDGPDAMALAYMNSAGVKQMLGYIMPTSYGYGGWGCLDYFVEQPGRYTFTEAFFANEHALIHRLATYFPELVNAEVDENGQTSAKIVLCNKAKAAGLTEEDGRWLLFDRDAVAFYGDPAWEARMAKMPTAWDQTLTEKDGVWTLEIKPNRGAKTFEPINTNGSQRGGRPIVQFLPHRIQSAQVLEGADLNPVITDDFVLVPNPKEGQPGKEYRVVFRAVKLNYLLQR
jgi:zinc protease